MPMLALPSLRTTALTVTGGFVLAHLIAALFFALHTLPAYAQGEIFVETATHVLDPSDPQRTEFGELVFKGGLEIQAGEENIGGLSGLTWHEDRLYTVSDEGRWFAITPDEDNARLIDIFAMESGPLLDDKGKRLKRKSLADAEAITRSSEGAFLVAFERDHRVWRYDDLLSAATPTGITVNPDFSGERDNKGMETLASFEDALLVCEQYVGANVPNCRWEADGASVYFELATTLGGRNLEPTGAACSSTGDCFVLMRDYKEGVGNHIAIVALSPGEDPRLIAGFTPDLAIDNFEGLAVREQYGKTYLYIISDNNFSSNQRTLLLKFEVKGEAAPIEAVAPEPVVDYETQDVVLETELGAITIRLETERAPITAANFLRYIDEDRLNGTVFYRRMALNREPQPNGLIQGGVQFDPDRLLPDIPHEPTTQTGLSHTNGALSMAMGEPGTANGDFSIMLQDQTGLDARPEAEEAIWQNGYAVFGYVIDGMEVVYAIHARETDPSKGQGAMRGQLLADPVVIVDARRVVAEEESAGE